MINEIQELMDRYIGWLKDKTTLRQIDDQWVEITTPHLDRHNDYLQLYVRANPKGGLTLSDAGNTIDDLTLSGCELKTPKRQDLLRMTLNGFGVKAEHDELTVQANSDSFALQKHNLVQAMLAVNDMFYLSKPTVSSLFLEDVTSWLEDNEVRYTPRVKFTGRTGYDHMFDFVIPKSKKKPERILQSINRPTRDKAEALVFAWMDTRETRDVSSLAYAMLNDAEKRPSTAVFEALRNYDIHPVLWSEREDALADLAA